MRKYVLIILLLIGALFYLNLRPGWVDKANDLFNAKAYDEVVSLASKEILNDTRNPEGYFVYGKALLKMGSHEEAWNKFEEAARLDPTLREEIGEFVFWSDEGVNSTDLRRLEMFLPDLTKTNSSFCYLRYVEYGSPSDDPMVFVNNFPDDERARRFILDRANQKYESGDKEGAKPLYRMLLHKRYEGKDEQEKAKIQLGLSGKVIKMTLPVDDQWHQCYVGPYKSFQYEIHGEIKLDPDIYLNAGKTILFIGSESELRERDRNSHTSGYKGPDTFRASWGGEGVATKSGKIWFRVEYGKVPNAALDVYVERKN